MTSINNNICVNPSLVICVTSECDMDCIYCPPGGENIVPSESLCDERTIFHLFSVAKQYGIEMIRLTGGEPLLYPQRTHAFLKEGTKYNFNRFVLNTNGAKLIENIDWLTNFAGMFECKVSLDSLDPNVYHKVTKTDSLNLILDGITRLSSLGVKVVINCVVSKLNVNTVFDVIEFCDSHSLDLKLFDISDYGNVLQKRWASIYQPIDDLIIEIARRYPRSPDERLIGGRGRMMSSFRLKSGAKMLIINHHGHITGDPLFSEKCKACENYPCSSGMLSLTLRSDGLLSICNLRPDLGVPVSGHGRESITNLFGGMMSTFRNLHSKETI